MWDQPTDQPDTREKGQVRQRIKKMFEFVDQYS